MRAYRHALWAILLSTSVWLFACEDPAGACCDCLIEAACWDHQICPDDPMGSCLYIRGDGDVPGYAGGDEWQVCYATGVDCEAVNCSSECSDI